MRSPDVAAERHAIVLAGPPGAGKSTVLDEVLVDRGRYLVIDADEFKRALLHEAVRDGSYESWIKPEEVADLERAGERFFPLELASLVHEESSRLAKKLRDEAIEEGLNIVIDTVLSSEGVALDLGQQLRANGYNVHVIDVEVPYEVSEARIRGRWVEAYTRALDQGDGLGGRWVPSEYARDVFAGPDGSSTSEASARRLARECDAVTRYQLFRTTAHQAAPNAHVEPVLEVDMVRTRPEVPLVDRVDKRTVALDRAAQVRAAVSRPISEVAGQALTHHQRHDRNADPTSRSDGPDQRLSR